MAKKRKTAKRKKASAPTRLVRAPMAGQQISIDQAVDDQDRQSEGDLELAAQVNGIEDGKKVIRDKAARGTRRPTQATE